MCASASKAVICVDRSVSGAGCGWEIYTPVALGAFGHTRAPFYSRDLDEAKAWCAAKGYEFEVRS